MYNIFELKYCYRPHYSANVRQGRGEAKIKAVMADAGRIRSLREAHI